MCSSALDRCKNVPTPRDLFCSGHVLLPDGRVETIDAGHLIHTREPVAFTERLLEFLDR